MAPKSLLRLLALAPGIATALQTLNGFDSPSKEYRAKFRYWFHDASLDHEILAEDIRALQQIGAGGLEIVPFYNYGFGGPGQERWDEFGFGTPAFKDVLVTALETCKEYNLVMDFAIGASQGQGVPVEPLTPGLAVQLMYGKATVRGGATFEGALPGPIIDWNEVPGFMQPQEKFGDSRLVGVSAAGVKSGAGLNNTQREIVLDEASLLDLTESVAEGRLVWTAPSDHEEYIVFALYERFTNQRSCKGIPADTIANGSWVTDHFSSAGSKLVTKFWNDHLLDGQVRDLLKAVGQHSWEDSMEIQASLYWTPDFIERFKSARGYDPTKYLPLLFHSSTAFHGNMAPYDVTYVLELENAGQSKYHQDYRLTLNEGLMEYLQSLDEWALSLGVSHSAQVAYNMPVDVLATVPSVSGPELESLGFTDIDIMLQFVGSAHLSGRNVVSTEVGAVPSGAYSLTLPSLVYLFTEAFAGGVNMMLIHGMSYGGEFPNTTWPGYTPFQYRFTELWSPRQPAWDFMSDIMEYTARNQLVLQTGVAKRDLAFYLFQDPWMTSIKKEAGDIRSRGFTYEYLSPFNLATENATVSDSVLASSGPAYKALVIENQFHISPDASQKLVDFAEAGLPIVVIGGLPNTTIGSSGQDVVSENIASLGSSHYTNVRFIENEDELVQVLDDLHVTPRVSVEASEPAAAAADLYTLWRSDANADYVFLYNKGSPATFGLTFAVGKDSVPASLNAWTGEQELIMAFNRYESGVNLNLTLQQHQTALIAFIPGEARPYVTSHTVNVVKIHDGPDGRLSVLINEPKAAKLIHSDKTTELIPELTQKPDVRLPNFEIGPWNLTLESWVPVDDPSDTHSAKKTLHLGPQAQLRPWSDFPAIQNVSGVGTYSASFIVPTLCYLPYDQTATIINFGQVLNTLRVWINGQQLPAVDITDAELDVSNYVVQGENSIEVVVSSTLFNAVKARADSVKMFGTGPLDIELYTNTDWQPHGLVGPVRLTILRKVLV
ncbi:unnamed protein product [Clonostachys solani]|uniref:Glycosyl hydrolases family 2 sugar binding domain-containing protein n=1 Tax=Clonostachys solani TaxID=160281 RepID=A0A9N9ZKK1_9HYPO|nr:unnamed protein product [Clonostachys solani]